MIVVVKATSTYQLQVQLEVELEIRSHGPSHGGELQVGSTLSPA